MKRVAIVQSVTSPSRFEARVVVDNRPYPYNYTQAEKHFLRNATTGDFTLAMCLVAARGAKRMGLPFDPDPLVYNLMLAPMSVAHKARFASMVARIESNWTKVGENLYQRGNRLAEIDFADKAIRFSRPIAVEIPQKELVYAQ